MTYSIIFNEGDLTLSGFVSDFLDDDTFDVNDLHSHTMIDQRGSTSSSVVISDSNFIGSKFAVWIRYNIRLVDMIEVSCT